MALRAVVREVQSLMVRIGRAVEIRGMTIIARRWQPLVHVVDVTLRAGHCLMRACEREARRIMAEC